MSGVILYKAHRELSADAKTLTLTVTGTNADGSLLNQTTVFTRVTGARGLVGTWRDTRTDAGAPAMFVISSPPQGSCDGNCRNGNNMWKASPTAGV